MSWKSPLLLSKSYGILKKQLVLKKGVRNSLRIKNVPAEKLEKKGRKEHKGQNQHGKRCRNRTENAALFFAKQLTAQSVSLKLLVAALL